VEFDIKIFDETILRENYDDFLALKNYNSSLHFDQGDIDGFNRKKIDELFGYFPQGKAFVLGAFIESKLVGFIWGYPRVFFEEKRMFINSLVVDKEYAKLGIGKQLIKQLGQCAKSKLNCEALDLMVASSNKNAIGFYEHLGFNVERHQMRVSI
jgi:ribosomal protein S18 acetylase RimI-like enzyme